MRRIGSVLIAAAIGAIFGFAAGSWRSVRSEKASTSPSAAVPVISEAKRESTAGKQTNPPLKRVGEESKAGLLRLKTVAELNGRLSNKIYYPLVQLEKLNPDFVALYDLSPDQVARLRDAIADARNGVKRIEAQVAVLDRKDDGSIVVTIPPFPTEGGALYDSLNKALADILGSERYSFYRQMSGGDLDNTMEFDRFGLSQTVISIAPMSDSLASWSAGNDPKTGMLNKTAKMDPRAVKNLEPLIYDRLVAAGLAKAQ